MLTKGQLQFGRSLCFAKILISLLLAVCWSPNVNALPMQAQPASQSTDAREVQAFTKNRMLAKRYLAQKKVAQAIPFLEKSRSLNDSDFENGYDLAIAYTQTGQIARARAEAIHLVTIRDCPDVHSLLGGIEDAAHDTKAAAAQYQIAAQMDPSEVRIFDFGQSLLAFDSDAAIKIFTYGVEKYPNSARLRVGLGVAFYLYRKFDRAAETLCQAVDMNPSDPRPIEFLGKLQNFSPQMSQQVIRRLSDFLKLHPDSGAANYYLARNVLREPSQADMARAERLLRNAIRLSPKLADAYFELGRLYEMEGKKSDAVLYYQYAIRLNPSQSRYHYRLSVALQATGQTAKAKQEAEEFRRLHSAEDALDERDVREVGRQSRRP
jgi:tetratricopeptide (TPR) repeat protein